MTSSDRLSEPEVRVGQVWRRKKDGQIVVIDGIRDYMAGSGQADDVFWREPETGNHGLYFAPYFRGRHEFIQEAPDV